MPYLSNVLLTAPSCSSTPFQRHVNRLLPRPLGLGDFPNHVPGLVKPLETEASSVDRRGEALAGLGLYHLLPDIIVVTLRCGVSLEKASSRSPAA